MPPIHIGDDEIKDLTSKCWPTIKDREEAAGNDPMPTFGQLCATFGAAMQEKATSPSRISYALNHAGSIFAGWYGVENPSPAPDPTPGPAPRRTGPVTINRRVMRDDQGEYFALGASLFFGQWAIANDVERFDRFCGYFASKGIQYIRNLGEVRGGPWSAEDGSQGGRFPDRDWRSWAKRDMSWDNPRVFEYAAAGTERAYNQHGLRTEWTIFGSGEQLPNYAARERFVDRFIREVVAPRPHMIQHLEICNEGWQTLVIPREQYMNEVRALYRFARQLLKSLGLGWLGISSSSPMADQPFETQWTPLVDGLDANMATIHFDRNYQQRGWRPVRQPWDAQFAPGFNLFASMNEPIGPGSSVAGENDPLHMAMYIPVGMCCGMGAYVYHCDAGIWSQPSRREWPWEHEHSDAILDGIRTALSLMPPDGANWARFNHHWTTNAYNPGHPFTDLGEVDRTFIRNFAITSGSGYYTTPIGVLGMMTIQPRWKSLIEVFHPLTGDVLHAWDAHAGQTFQLPGEDRGGLAAYIIRGTNR